MATPSPNTDAHPARVRRHGLARLLMPQLPLDAGERWMARSVCFVTCGVAAGIVAAVVNGALSGAQVGGSPTWAQLGELALLVPVLWLNRSGAPDAAARLLAFSLPVFAATLMITSGQGFRDVAVLILPASLILCGLLLDRATLVAVTLLTVACTASTLVAETHGWLAAPSAPNSVADVVDAGIILVVTSLGVGLVAGRLRESHARLRRQEAELRASEALYRGLVDLAADAIVVSLPGGSIVEANCRASELTGRSRQELLGLAIETLFGPAELARAPFRYDLADQGRIVVNERALVRSDGARVPVEMSSRRMPDGQYQTILRDVSERQRAEAERRALEVRLRQSQKMEAVGRLAGGVAHDFNNLLTAITGSLALALRDVRPDARAHRWLTETDKAAWRAAALTHQLLAFSRQQVIAPQVLDLRSVVSGAGSMLARMIGEDIALRTELPDDPCLVEVDQGQLEQVLLNLAANARDAMPDGGVLSIEVSRAVTGPEAGGRLRPGPAVVMAVSDTGQGMSEDVRARIFEPFFTTKSVGSGTGLGLAMVYGAVEQNGGSIEVVSAPGRGASFRILLPEARGEKAAAPPAQGEVPRGSETVLLVEDEAAVREVTRAQLESLGYRVLSCANAAEALVVAAGHVEPLHLLLTDVVMPGMNGRELAARLGERRGSLRVLFTSGYGEEVIARHGVLEPGVLLLQKPYGLARLASRVREALQAQPVR
jgi:two-component system cell cycle sensor histidine kinase/response regulator CckA